MNGCVSHHNRDGGRKPGWEKGHLLHFGHIEFQKSVSGSTDYRIGCVSLQFFGKVWAEDMLETGESLEYRW